MTGFNREMEGKDEKYNGTECKGLVKVSEHVEYTLDS